MRDRDNVNIMLTDREQIPSRMKGKKSRGDECIKCIVKSRGDKCIKCIAIAAHCEEQIPYGYKG
jgi:hypothetical protein